MAKWFSAALAACIATWACASFAEQPTLYIGHVGGSTEEFFKKSIIPPFEAKYGVKVAYVTGDSTANLARLQAQRGNQQLDVVLLDEGPMYQALSLGLCGPIEASPELNQLYDIARLKGGNAVGVGFIATGLVYNTELFRKNGWQPPTSWRDLADPRYRNQIEIPSITNTYGVDALVMMARVNGGSETNIDPGFDFLTHKVSANVFSYEPSAGTIAQMFQTGQVSMAVWGTNRLKALTDAGFPGALAYPREGSVAVMVAACPVKDNTLPAQSQAFIRYLLSADVQARLAEHEGYGPTNRTVQLPPAVSKGVPYGPEQVGKLIAIDWTTVNRNRADWTRRWTREVER